MKHIQQVDFASVYQLLEFSQTHETLSVIPRRQISAESASGIATSASQGCVHTRFVCHCYLPARRCQDEVLSFKGCTFLWDSANDQWHGILCCSFLILPTAFKHFFLSTSYSRNVCLAHVVTPNAENKNNFLFLQGSDLILPDVSPNSALP